MPEHSSSRVRNVSLALLGLTALLSVPLTSAFNLGPAGYAPPGEVLAQTVDAGGSVRKNEFLQSARFIQIPGPNPVLTRGGKGTWDERLIEACDAFEDFSTYYLFYHGRAMDEARWGGGYQIGVATARHPLGPWTKQGDQPMLELGPPGSWDDQHVACAMIVKVGHDKYYMWYSGRSSTDTGRAWNIGLATSSTPLGPWKKHEGNPILHDFGYVGGVVFVDNKYYLYTAYPVGSVSPDYSPMALATADAPEGPWTKWENNPVLSPGGPGSWDEGGFAESEVVYWDGVFHMFYDGARYHRELGRRTAIGYAYSFDGYNFTKYGRNPVASSQAPGAINIWESKEMPQGARMMGETHTLIEPPFIYLYTTIRPSEQMAIGVQVLATQTPFRIDMPVLRLNSLGPGAGSALEACPPLSLSNINRVALTTECTFSSSARAGVRVHVQSSYDGLNYDTSDFHTIEIKAESGRAARKTVELDAPVKYIKVWVENLDKTEPVSDVKITATLGN